MEYKNKYSHIVEQKYSNDEKVFELDTLGKKVEFLTKMNYIKQYAQKGAKILEIGAGTGLYSIALAKMGFEVTAIELVERNLEVMKEHSKDLTNIKCLKGDALNLDMFEDNEFDVVLNFGPMYHLYNNNDRIRAINESLRVCKSQGVAMFAYITHASVVWTYAMKNCVDELATHLLPGGAIKDDPMTIYSSFFIEDFKKLFDGMDIEHLSDVSCDSIIPLMSKVLEEDISEKDFDIVLKYHFDTCERLDMQGFSGHMLYIGKKN